MGTVDVSGHIIVFDTDTNTQSGEAIVLPGGVHPFGLVASADGSIVYAAIPGYSESGSDNKVYAIDARYHSVLDTNFHSPGVQPLTVGTSPWAMAFNPVTNQLYVLNNGAGTISTVSMTRL